MPTAIELHTSSGRPTTTLTPQLRRSELRVRELEGQIRDMRSALVCSFNQLLDLRDLNTGVHSTRLAEWGLLVARDLGVPERCMPDLEMGALLHDIGKIGVPERNSQQSRTPDPRRIRSREAPSRIRLDRSPQSAGDGADKPLRPPSSREF